jgi:hypothetical protein
MKRALVMVGVMVFSSPALADPNPTLGGRWGYDRGDYYGRSYNEAREYKQDFYRGPCKIERKRERNGEYKEETKCKGPANAVQAASVRRPNPLYRQLGPSGEVCCRAAELYLPLYSS